MIEASDLGRLLRSQLEAVRRQAEHLAYTRIHLGHPSALDRVKDPEVLEKYEALTARFSRLQDLLIHPFRTVAILEMEEERTERIPDLLNLMEKRGIVPEAEMWRTMRGVRNAIAHEAYEEGDEKLRELLSKAFDLSGALLDIVRKLEHYADNRIFRKGTTDPAGSR